MSDRVDTSQLVSSSVPTSRRVHRHDGQPASIWARPRVACVPGQAGCAASRRHCRTVPRLLALGDGTPTVSGGMPSPPAPSRLLRAPYGQKTAECSYRPHSSGAERTTRGSGRTASGCGSLRAAARHSHGPSPVRQRVGRHGTPDVRRALDYAPSATRRPHRHRQPAETTRQVSRPPRAIDDHRQRSDTQSDRTQALGWRS